MVNLKKEENKRKPISLIKPQNNINVNDSTSNILCEPLASEYEPRIKHPVYSRNQFENLNRQRTVYKDPEKFDVLPGPPPQNLNYPAVPQIQHLPQQNTNKKLYADTNGLFEMARIRNNQAQNNNNNNNSYLNKNLSEFQIILTILIMIILFIVFFPLFKSGMIFPVILISSPFVKIIAGRNNTKHK